LGGTQIGQTTPPQRTVSAAPRFIKAKKKLSTNAQLETDEQVKEILKDPLKGEPKTGALRGVRVVKFKADDRQYLLAYTSRAKVNTIEVLDIGVHENFYKGWQDYLAARPTPK
jgi:mRNA-degrading endonuclease RelE of RelBE toxin-antitoxin system